MQIQWYPGHMTKARRQLEESLKPIDVVVELLDARAPFSSQNPDFSRLFVNKLRVVLLNKSDLANKSVTKAWLRYFENNNIDAAEFVSTSSSVKKTAIAKIESAAAEKVAAMKKKGVIKTVRAIVVGIPNVGKSTLINTIAGKTRATVGDKPGVTKGQQWVKITPYLELMDTPGLLWPKFEDENIAKHVAYIGSVRDDILDYEELSTELLFDLNRLDPAGVTNRYKDITPETKKEDLLTAVCTSRGFMQKESTPDLTRASRIVLDEYRAGKIAKVTFELPPK